MTGPAVAATCDVCNHPEIATIHHLVFEGKLSGMRIGSRFGLEGRQVSRHVYREHPGVRVVDGGRWKTARTQKRPDPKVPDDDTSEVDRLKTMRTQLEEVMKTAPRSDTARELRQVHQRIAELDGASQPKRVGIADVRGLRDQVAKWFVALERFPEAREAMLAVTDPSLFPTEE